MPTLRQYAEQCRRLALTTRSEAMRDRLLVMAHEMDRDAAQRERQEAAETDREAG